MNSFQFSVWHWLIVILFVAIYAWPITRILRRAGYSGWWAILGVIPLINIIAALVFAFADWPALRGRKS